MTPDDVELRPEHRRIILQILRASLPPETKAWVFGSRVSGQARPHSDLDLAIDVGRCLTLDERAILAEAFAESDLPFKVDVVDWRGIQDGFRDRIAAERQTLHGLAEAAETGADPTDSDRPK